MQNDRKIIICAAGSRKATLLAGARKYTCPSFGISCVCLCAGQKRKQITWR